MTVSSTTNKSQYIGNGSTTMFIYDFIVHDAAHMVVSIDGAVQASGFSVSGANDPSGGTVTFDTAPAAPVSGVSEAIIVLLRSVPQVQDLDLRAYDAFPAEAVETQLDLLVLLAQDLQEQVSRSVGGSITTPDGTDLTWPPYLAGHAISWSDATQTLENTALPIDQYLTDAQTARDAAQASSTSAGASSTSASNSNASAGNSASNAAASEALAQRWADEAEDVPVVTGPDEYSAFHWAQKASAIVIGNVSAVDIDNVPAGSIAATDVQTALNELDTKKVDGNHTHDATTITNTPAGNIAATNMQAAIDELDSEKSGTGHNHDTAYEAVDSAILRSDVASTLTVGMTTTPEALGSDSITPDFDTVSIKTRSTTGNVTINNATGGQGAMHILFTIDGTDRSVSYGSGMMPVVGAPTTLVNGKKYVMTIIRVSATFNVVSILEVA